MIEEVYDKKSKAILFKKSEDTKNIERLEKRVEALEEKIEELEKRLMGEAAN